MSWLRKRAKSALTGKSKGFTLIELLIVIACTFIGIMMAIQILVIFCGGEIKESTPQTIESTVIDGAKVTTGDIVVLKESADMTDIKKTLEVGDTIVLKESTTGQ